MVQFKTIVILDLETTGLPSKEYGLTKITELTLLACIASHCHNCRLPRVINKLTLGLNPRKNISPDASRITGLCNEILEEMRPFDDDVVLMLNAFLERLPAPVCLIAHNGNKFDFPILKRHLLNCKTNLKDIHCADSLVAFREILVKAPSQQEADEDHYSPIQESQSLQDDNSELKINTLEKTPEKRPVPCNANPVKPENSPRLAKYSNAFRRLNFDTAVAENNSVNNCDSKNLSDDTSLHIKNDIGTMKINEKSKRVLKSFKLIDIYMYFHDGGRPSFHKSEDDCLALLSCIVKCKEIFLEWLDHNAVLFSDIKPSF